MKQNYIYEYETIFMNSGNSKTSDGLLLNLSDKINLKKR